MTNTYPANPHTVRLTADNIDTELLPGDRFADDPDFGTVKSHRPAIMAPGEPAAQMVYTTASFKKDIFGLPQTVRIIRTA